MKYKIIIIVLVSTNILSLLFAYAQKVAAEEQRQLAEINAVEAQRLSEIATQQAIIAQENAEEAQRQSVIAMEQVEIARKKAQEAEERCK